LEKQTDVKDELRNLFLLPTLKTPDDNKEKTVIFMSPLWRSVCEFSDSGQMIVK